MKPFYDASVKDCVGRSIAVHVNVFFMYKSLNVRSQVAYSHIFVSLNDML